jgi:sugar transferase (PEP-CTERM/EpsH1 system associated)
MEILLHCLYLAQRVPYPPNKGEKLRSFHQINYLRAQHVSITVAAPYEDDEELQYFETLSQSFGCKTIMQPLGNILVRYLNGFLRHHSLSESHFHCKGLQQKVDSTLATEEFDAIVCTASSMASYIFRSKTLKTLRIQPRLIMDFMDMDSHKWHQYAQNAALPMRWVYQREAGLVNRLENRIGENFDACFFVAPPETELYRKQMGKTKAKILSIGNGIDPAEFYPGEASQSSDTPHLLFAGVMDYTPNVDAMLWFYTEVWPAVISAWPDATLTIAGMNPTPAIAKLNGIGNVKVTGFVEDILPYFHNSNIFIAPFRIARGIQNKILQAFACGLPVVSTSMGAEGIRCSPGVNIEVGDEANDMFNAIERLINDKAHFQSLRKQGLATIEQYYSWDGTLAPLLQLIKEK